MNVSRILSLAAIILVIGWNYLATFLPLNNNEIAVLSEKYATFLNPAPYAFSIWGAIYIGLLAYGIYQVMPARKDVAWIDTLRQPLWINLGLNAAWISFFHYELLLPALISMIGILVTLGIIFHRLRTMRRITPPWVVGTFHTYLGWIAVATAVNVALYLHHLGVGHNVANERLWYFIILSVIFLFTVFFSLRFQGPLFALTVAWALIAIGLDQPGGKLSLEVTPMILGVLLIVEAVILFGFRKTR